MVEKERKRNWKEARVGRKAMEISGTGEIWTCLAVLAGLLLMV